jgi:hypothetical protein
LIFLSVSLLIFVIGFSAALLLSRRLPRSLMPVVAVVLWSVLAAVRRTVEIVLAKALDAAGADASPFPIILAISSTLAWVILIAGLQAVNVLRRETSAGVEANIQQLQRLNAARWEQLDAERTTMARWIRRTVTPSMDRLSAMIAASPIRWQEPGFAKQVEKIAESSREVVRQASHDMTSLAGRAEALRGAINEAEGEIEYPTHSRPPTCSLGVSGKHRITCGSVRPFTLPPGLVMRRSGVQIPEAARTCQKSGLLT